MTQGMLSCSGWVPAAARSLQGPDSSCMHWAHLQLQIMRGWGPWYALQSCMQLKNDDDVKRSVLPCSSLHAPHVPCCMPQAWATMEGQKGGPRPGRRSLQGSRQAGAGQPHPAERLGKVLREHSSRFGCVAQAWATMEGQKGDHGLAEDFFKAAEKLELESPILLNAWARF